MGFSLTGTHVIFFIAAVIAAGMVSGVFIAVTMNVSTSLSDRGDRVKDQLDTDFAIINDPSTIPAQGNYYIFYLKNIGGKKLTTTNQTFQVFLDGEIISTSNYYFMDSSIVKEAVTNLYVNATIPAGDHTLRVVGPQATEDEFMFTR
jgi:archaellum component FlaG (FlaF/FlaG flagellin family)